MCYTEQNTTPTAVGRGDGGQRGASDGHVMRPRTQAPSPSNRYAVVVGCIVVGFLVSITVQIRLMSGGARPAARSPRRLAALLHWPQTGLPVWQEIAKRPSQQCLYTKMDRRIVADSDGRICFRHHQFANGCCSVALPVEVRDLYSTVTG